MSTTVAEVPARAHLAGNPSDGYGGAVLSTTVPSLTARVEVTAADRISIAGPEESWATTAAMVDATRRLGYDGGDRLVRAALVALDGHLPPGDRRPGRFEWSTTIPRSVGLGGSSAVVVATMRAALEWWEVYDGPTDLRLASLALAAETHELGIAAGLADRAVQVLGGVVLTDCRDEPTANSVDVGTTVSLSLLSHDDAAAPSGHYHARLREAVDSGDATTAAGLEHLAGLADGAARAVADGDVEALAATFDDSLETRRRLGPVPAAALDGVERLREQGAAVNFAGSGGTLVVLGHCEAPRGWARTDVVLAPGVSPAPAPSPSTRAGP